MAVEPEYVPCETVAAITVHLRQIGESETLCGSRVGWDLSGDPRHEVRCRDCMTAAGWQPPRE